MIILLPILIFIYVLAMVWLLIGGVKLPYFKAPNIPSVTSFSIIVPFRNEAENLPLLLRSIEAGYYPLELFEVILVNDDSQDASLEIIEQLRPSLSFELKVIQNKRTSVSPKKDAITTAIQEARFDWIITTDADCEVPPGWLRLYDQFIQKKQPKMVCGPVLYPSGINGLNSYQFLDGLSLQAATMGSFGWNRPMLCNGANLSYMKTTFQELNGYKGNDHIASGDDIFLLQKIKNNFPREVRYLKNIKAVVLTQGEKTWEDVISQRVRWASKTTKQKNWDSKLLGGIILLGNLAFLLSFIALFIDSSRLIAYTVCILMKLLMDWCILTLAAHFFKKSVVGHTFFKNALVYPIITLKVVMKSMTGKYIWKGRKFKK